MEFFWLVFSHLVVYGIGFIVGGNSFRKKIEREANIILEEMKSRLKK